MSTAFEPFTESTIDIIPLDSPDLEPDVLSGDLDEIATNHPFLFFIGGITVIFTWPVWPFKMLWLGTLSLIGFGRGGVRRGSAATTWHREIYGGYVPLNSTFASFQSQGALGFGMEDEVPLYARALGWVAGWLAVRSLFR